MKMLATAIILFREVLEAALIISIVMGASRGIAQRGRWVAGGIVLGLLGASLVALGASDLPFEFAGRGSAIMNASILLCAVVVLTWHTVWMKSHGRKLAEEITTVGKDVQAGKQPLTALMILTFIAVMREGSEAVLFIWAIATSDNQELSMIVGGLAGVLAGVLVGTLLYRGLLRIPLRHFFSFTSWLILLLTAGLSAQAAGFLNQADLLPALSNSLWDTSHLLSQGSLFGQILHTLIGYIARPSGIEVAFYIGTILTVLLLMRLFGGSGSGSARHRRDAIRQATS
jgi:high-affinity iron transporter